MAVRPSGLNSETVPLTQFFHEWVHELQDNGFLIADGSRGKPSFPKDKDAENAVMELYKTAGDVFPYCSNSLGEKKFKEQAVQGFEREYNCKFDPAEIIFTPGGQFGISASFYLIENLFPGSCIISAKPWYLNHHDLACMFTSGGFDAIPKHDKFHNIDLLKNGVERLTAQHIETAILDCKNAGKKIGAFLFCNPANPLGMVTTKDEWKKIGSVLDAYPEALILLDEAFGEVIFDQNFEVSLLHARPDLKDRVILFRSGTKALGFPGERLAVMNVPKKYLNILTSFQSRVLGAAPLSTQAAMAASLQSMTLEKKKAISEYYYGNYKFLREGLKKIGVEPIFEPEGGFYCLVDFSKFRGVKIPERSQEILQSNTHEITTDFELSVSLMTGLLGTNRGVATIPASAFGVESRKMLLRVSFSSYKEEIAKFIEYLS